MAGSKTTLHDQGGVCECQLGKDFSRIPDCWYGRYFGRHHAHL